MTPQEYETKLKELQNEFIDSIAKFKMGEQVKVKGGDLEGIIVGRRFVKLPEDRIKFTFPTSDYLVLYSVSRPEINEHYKKEGVTFVTTIKEHDLEEQFQLKLI